MAASEVDVMISTDSGLLDAGPSPTDSGGDNLYDIEVSVSDGTNSNTQALIVSVLDLNEKLGLTNKVINENENTSSVGRAHFRLGNYLVRQAEIAREIRANPDSLDKFNLFYGANLTVHLQTVDLAELRKDALKQYAVAVEKYSNVRTYKGELSELAGREKFKIEHLSVGGNAPEIIGEDIAGKAMKLSDYRGKVVLLDFWGDWCVACRMLLPFNRALVKEMEGRPFELLGVNSDTDRIYVRKVEQTQNITWRSFWNGGSRFGDISTEWAVEKWPVLYVIDAQGVVQMRSAGGHNKDEILKLIEKLVSEAEGK